MRTSLQHGGRSHELIFEEAVVHLEGEFGGNIDVVVTFDPPVSKRQLLPSLWLREPGESSLLDVVGLRSSSTA